jgi:hypothetical protein
MKHLKHLKHILATSFQCNIFFLLGQTEARRRGERGQAAGLAQAGTGEGWRRSDLTAPGLAAQDLGVGRDSGWKAAGLARASIGEG